MNYKELRKKLEMDEPLTKEERTKLGKYIIRTEGFVKALEILGMYKKQAD
jgi:hypothetical protein